MIKVRIFLRTFSDSDLLLIFVSRNLTVTQVYVASMPFCKSSHIYCNPTTIHAPRVGSDVLNIRQMLHAALFQSTLPVWGATTSIICFFVFPIFISIHAPRVGSDYYHHQNHHQKSNISIHAPRVGSDDPAEYQKPQI